MNILAAGVLKLNPALVLAAGAVVVVELEDVKLNPPNPPVAAEEKHNFIILQTIRFKLIWTITFKWMIYFSRGFKTFISRKL